MELESQVSIVQSNIRILILKIYSIFFHGSNKIYFHNSWCEVIFKRTYLPRSPEKYFGRQRQRGGVNEDPTCQEFLQNETPTVRGLAANNNNKLYIETMIFL